MEKNGFIFALLGLAVDCFIKAKANKFRGTSPKFSDGWRRQYRFVIKYGISTNISHTLLCTVSTIQCLYVIYDLATAVVWAGWKRVWSSFWIFRFKSYIFSVFRGSFYLWSICIFSTTRRETFKFQWMRSSRVWMRSTVWGCWVIEYYLSIWIMEVPTLDFCPTVMIPYTRHLSRKLNSRYGG